MKGNTVRHGRAIMGAITVSVTLALIAGTALAATAHKRTHAGRYEVPGNPHNAPSWTFRNPRVESGRGPNLEDHQRILISCRMQAAKVSDGNVWWYRIAAAPWHNHYYVSADDFYNDGRSTGSLHGTPYYDAKVPQC